MAAAIPVYRVIRPALTSTTPISILRLLPVARFSTSPASCQRVVLRRDNNRERGVSALRRTGPRYLPKAIWLRTRKLGVEERQAKERELLEEYLPRPNPDSKRSQLGGHPEHPLWGFFKDKELLPTPVDMSSHGLSWTTADLRGKTWDDLHTLWWVCVKERNRLATERVARRRLNPGYGDSESTSRDETVQETMRAIQYTLLERYTAWEGAHELAKHDSEIDLSGNGPAYNAASEYNIDEMVDEEKPGAVEQSYDPSRVIKQRTRKKFWDI